jgi:hypothetical protein
MKKKNVVVMIMKYKILDGKIVENNYLKSNLIQFLCIMELFFLYIIKKCEFDFMPEDVYEI